MIRTSQPADPQITRAPAQCRPSLPVVQSSSPHVMARHPLVPQGRVRQASAKWNRGRRRSAEADHASLHPASGSTGGLTVAVMEASEPSFPRREWYRV